MLRLDDRGVGGSTGSIKSSTSEDFAGDVLAGLDFLKGRKEIDASKLGLIGHSEGGIIAPMVAARSKDVAFIVLMAGTAVPGAQILEAQGQLILKASGSSDSQMKTEREIQKRLIESFPGRKTKKSPGRNWPRPSRNSSPPCRILTERPWAVSWEPFPKPPLTASTMPGSDSSSLTTRDRHYGRSAARSWRLTANETCRSPRRKTSRRSTRL